MLLEIVYDTGIHGLEMRRRVRRQEMHFRIGETDLALLVLRQNMRWRIIQQHQHMAVRYSHFLIEIAQPVVEHLAGHPRLFVVAVIAIQVMLESLEAPGISTFPDD